MQRLGDAEGGTGRKRPARSRAVSADDYFISTGAYSVFSFVRRCRERAMNVTAHLLGRLLQALGGTGDGLGARFEHLERLLRAGHAVRDALLVGGERILLGGLEAPLVGEEELLAVRTAGQREDCSSA